MDDESPARHFIPHCSKDRSRYGHQGPCNPYILNFVGVRGHASTPVFSLERKATLPKLPGNHKVNALAVHFAQELCSIRVMMHQNHEKYR
jgi:hypothetical protein